MQLPDYSESQQQASELGLGIDAAELHGALCGLLSGGGISGRATWLGQIAPDSELPAPAQGSALDRLFEASRAQLAGYEMGLQLLMPGDEAQVSARAEALLSWCRGFLAGFGLSGRSLEALDPDAREAIQDIGHIAASQLDYTDPEEDDSALTEIIEYVRIAAQLLYENCVEAPPRSPRSLH